jgi:hypothetical protein
MGRLHSNGKGISASALPWVRSPPSWLKTPPEQVIEQIAKLARKGVTPSQIGVVLRDSHGIAQVKSVTGMFAPESLVEGLVYQPGLRRRTRYLRVAAKAGLIDHALERWSKALTCNR